uniref:VP7 n=1 Tax=viral metagenome TaxID=1070528 RepID=A0A2V0RLE8_9ZZZZ
MNINFYSTYSVGVKTRLLGRKLLRTRARAAIGSFVIGNAKTNIDPNALLLRKDSARIFIVDANDFKDLMRNMKYSAEKAIAYYEAVTQIPHTVRNLYAYTNKRHKPPSSGSSGIRRMPKIIWFSNTWDRHSWVRNMTKEDGGYPCFWTKDHSAITDPFSKAWKLYDTKFPDRGWRITYDVHTDIDSVFTELTSFIEMHQDEEELHVWIQGTLNGSDPPMVINDLKKLVSGLNLNSSHINENVKVILMPSGSGKTFYSKMFEHVIDIDDIYNGATSIQKRKRKETMESESWTLHNEVNAEIILKFYEDGGLNNKILLTHGEDSLRKIPYEIVGKYKVPMSELASVLEERSDDPFHVKMTKLNWSTSNYSIKNRDEIKDLIHQQTSTMATDSEIKVDVRNTEYTSLWDTPIEKSYDLWEMYGSKTPTRIPVIPWRVSNLGPRIYKNGLPPQLFPSTTIMKKLNISLDGLNTTEIYGNYSEFVTLSIISESDIKTLDFGWRAVGNNLYAMSEISEDNYADLYKVEDIKFFMGCGSVITAAHACFGVGRSNDELLFQLERKMNTGHGTSGHMIASVLAFQSHFLWYLEEVFENFHSGKSVYVTKFNEPGSGAYHTIHEYRNAIHDMKRSDTNKLYPGYARNNLGICEKFVSNLQI